MFVLFNVVSCIGFGVLLALVLSLGLVFLAMKLFSPVRIKLFSWVLLLFMTLLICYQSVLLVGGGYAKSYMNDISESVLTVVNTTRTAIDGTVSTFYQHEQVLEDLTEKYPLLQSYISEINLQEYINSGLSVPEIVVKELNSMVNFYMLRRVLWILGFLLLGVIVVAYSRTPYQSSSSLGSGFPMDFD